MKRRILMLLTIALGALLQQTLPVWPLFGGMKPPILAAIALHYALRRDNRDMWLALIVAALLRDGLDLGTFGPGLIAFPIIGIVAQRIRNEVFSDGLISQLVFGAALGLFTALITLLIYAVSGQRPLHPGMVFMRLSGPFGSAWPRYRWSHSPSQNVRPSSPNAGGTNGNEGAT